MFVIAESYTALAKMLRDASAKSLARLPAARFTAPGGVTGLSFLFPNTTRRSALSSNFIGTALT